MGYLPGFATPRLVCDVPYLGKRWVHQVVDYDRERGISVWSGDRRHVHYDPIHTLPESGRSWWTEQTDAKEHACPATTGATPTPASRS
jgi:lysine 2,3-aminomutase